MSESTETTADIIAEMRGDGHTGPADALEWVRIKLEHYADRIEAAYKREKAAIEADALEVGGIVGASHKRELSKTVSKNGADFGQLGDLAKLREALIDVVKRLEVCVGCDHHAFHPTATTCDGITSVGKCGKIATCAAIFKARAALAAPARNCDVGTAEEQAERMDKFCDSHGHGFDGLRTYSCENCKFISVDRCELAWAQMPYEKEGGAK